MPETKRQSFLKGAAILAAASIFVKVAGAVYRIPITMILGDTAYGYFQSAYSIYSLFLMISTAGIPVALSRMVSSDAAKGRIKLVKRYFSVALPAFVIIGAAAMLVMFFFADRFAGFMNNSNAANGIRVIAPAVFFSCIVSVYRGYAQGFEYMIPTAASQVVEVACKAVFGIAAAQILVGRSSELPVVAAGAMTGVTIGLGLCIPLLVRFKSKLDKGLRLDEDHSELPGHMNVFGQLMKVCIPITIGASFMTIMAVIDSSVVLGRLQSGLGFSEDEASALYGLYSKCVTIFNLPSALIVPVSVSVVPAIAASISRAASESKASGAITGTGAGSDGSEAKGIMQSAVKLVNLLAMPASAGIMVLAKPILIALYTDSRQTAATIMTILGAAAFFLCLQFITTAILQANGFERITMITFPAGGLSLIILDYFLVGNPNIGITGSPVGTLACYTVISVLNIIFIFTRIKDRPKLGAAFAKPFVCAAAMAVVAFALYRLLDMFIPSVAGEGRLSTILCLGATIAVSVAVYLLLVIVTRAITQDDLKLLPKGEKLAKVLRIK